MVRVCNLEIHGVLTRVNTLHDVAHRIPVDGRMTERAIVDDGVVDAPMSVMFEETPDERMVPRPSSGTDEKEDTEANQ